MIIVKMNKLGVFEFETTDKKVKKIIENGIERISSLGLNNPTAIMAGMIGFLLSLNSTGVKEFFLEYDAPYYTKKFKKDMKKTIDNYLS